MAHLLKVYVLLDVQLDSAAMLREIAELSRRQRRAHVISELKKLAGQTQAAILAELEARRSVGEVGEVHSLWIANLLIAELSPAIIRRLAA